MNTCVFYFFNEHELQIKKQKIHKIVKLTLFIQNELTNYRKIFYKHILNSLQLLVDNHIFHNHLNFDSIVIDKMDCPLLSNFSFSINYLHPNIDEYIKHFIIAYEPSYIEWPIELHILSYLLTNKLNSLSSYNIENIINDVISNNNILNSFGDTVVSLYKTEALEYFNKYD